MPTPNADTRAWLEVAASTPKQWAALVHRAAGSAHRSQANDARLAVWRRAVKRATGIDLADAAGQEPPEAPIEY
eukprot:9827517-Lingulodinium_polyedra.AAC.1